MLVYFCFFTSICAFCVVCFLSFSVFFCGHVAFVLLFFGEFSGFVCPVCVHKEPRLPILESCCGAGLHDTQYRNAGHWWDCKAPRKAEITKYWLDLIEYNEIIKIYVFELILIKCNQNKSISIKFDWI